MAINFVRQPSETPNVRNIDDIIPFRYAYGNQNGYVKDKGNELSYTINGSNFRINSGRVVLQGVESDIDANGVTITVDNVATTRYYSIYYRVNLATNTTSIESEFSTTDYPEIDPGDDLTANTSGSANLVLYTFIATNGIIINVEKVVVEIDYINKKTKVDNATNSDNSDTLQNVDLSDSSVATFGDYIIVKKKLLWNGNVDIGSTTAVDIDLTQKYGGKKLEIECIVNNQYNDGSYRYLKLKFSPTPNNNKGRFYSYGFDANIDMNGNVFQERINFYIDRTEANENYSQGLRAYAFSQLSGYTTKNALLNFTITAIYEIIE